MAPFTVRFSFLLSHFAIFGFTRKIVKNDETRPFFDITRICNKHTYTFIYIFYLYTYSYYTCHMVKLLVLLVKKSCVRIEVGPMTVWPKKRCPDVVHDVIGFQPKEKWSRNHKEHLMHFSLMGWIYIYILYMYNIYVKIACACIYL